MTKNDFLDGLVSDESCVTLHLTNGVKLTGQVTFICRPHDGAEYDGLMLTRDGQTQLIERHAIGTMMQQQGGYSGDFNS